MGVLRHPARLQIVTTTLKLSRTDEVIRNDAGWSSMCLSFEIECLYL